MSIPKVVFFNPFYKRAPCGFVFSVWTFFKHLSLIEKCIWGSHSKVLHHKNRLLIQYMLTIEKKIEMEKIYYYTEIKFFITCNQKRLWL